jgi:hypothetical protein
MINKLERLKLHLERIGSPFVSYLNPGIAQGTVETFLRTNYGTDAYLPSALFDLYKWRDGTNSSLVPKEKEAYLAYEIFFNSISEVKEILEGYEFYQFRQNKLFPLFSSLNGEFIAASMDKEGRLYYCTTFDPELEPITSMYDNLDSFLSTINELYDIGYYFRTEDGIIEPDFDKYYDFLCIGERLNPKSDFWRIKM